MGVKFVMVAGSDSVVAIARNEERDVEAELLQEPVEGDELEESVSTDAFDSEGDDAAESATEPTPDQQEDESE